MSHRFIASIGFFVAASVALVLAADRGTNDAAKKWTPPRTAWGEPDLRGVWDFRTITSLERPKALAGKELLSDEEAAEFQT